MMSKMPAISQSEFCGVRVEVATALPYDTVRARLTATMGRASSEAQNGLAQNDVRPADDERESESPLNDESGVMRFARNDQLARIAIYAIDRRTIRWLLGNPLIAIPMVNHGLVAGLFAPVKLLLTEDNDKSGSRIIYLKPSSLVVVDDTEQALHKAALLLDEELAVIVSNAAQTLR